MFDNIIDEIVAIGDSAPGPNELAKRVPALPEDAVLFLGNAETTLNTCEDFNRVKFDSVSRYRLVA